MNVVVQLDLEIASFEAAIQHISHFVTNVIIY